MGTMDYAEMLARREIMDGEKCYLCSHKNVSHGSFGEDYSFVGIGLGLCGIEECGCMGFYGIQQNTHWYLALNGRGWTANPKEAQRISLLERGYHDCATIGCETVHRCSALDIFLGEICEEEGYPHYAVSGAAHTREAKSRSRTKGGEKVQKRKTAGRKVLRVSVPRHVAQKTKAKRSP